MLGHNVSNKVQNWKAILDDGDDVISNPELKSKKKTFLSDIFPRFYVTHYCFFFMKGRVD